jgi:hypothetical protein
MGLQGVNLFHDRRHPLQFPLVLAPEYAFDQVPKHFFHSTLIKNGEYFSSLKCMADSPGHAGSFSKLKMNQKIHYKEMRLEME